MLSAAGHAAVWAMLQPKLADRTVRAPTTTFIQVQLLPTALATVSQADATRSVAIKHAATAIAEGVEPTTADAFVASEQLDRPIVPKSAPDTGQLEGLGFSGFPIRLRLLIDALGQVVDVAVLQAQSGDEEAVAHLKAMFFATAYIPGQLHGRPVPSRTDIELSLGATQ